MASNSFYQHVTIDEYSATPKYVQLMNSITKAIKNQTLNLNDTLPSINDLSFELDISRDTAQRSYRHLKNIGIIGSVPGKGFFIKSIDIAQKHKIFLLFNKLSEHKKIIYDALADTLGELATIDFYIYNNDFWLFKKMLANRKDAYTHYVIITHFVDESDNAYELLNSIPKEKLILLDKLVPGVKDEFGAVYENFEKDIYSALERALDRLSKYDTLKLIFPEYTYHPFEIIEGFRRFCNQYAFNHTVVNDIAQEPIHAGEVYINLMEKDLVKLLDRILEQGLIVGKDVGVISYNEIPLKKYILNGITTMSTDFHLMGKQAAQLILENSKAHIEIPFHLILRDSL